MPFFEWDDKFSVNVKEIDIITSKKEVLHEQYTKQS